MFFSSSNVSQCHTSSWNTFHKHDNDTHSLWLSMWKRGFRQCAQRKTPRFSQWEQSKQCRIFSHSLSGSRQACLEFPLWRTSLTPNPFYISHFIMNCYCKPFDEPGKWVLKIRVTCQIGFQINSGNVQFSTKCLNLIHIVFAMALTVGWRPWPWRHPVVWGWRFK